MAWSKPVPADCFIPNAANIFLKKDKINYPKTGVHPGVDYPWSRLSVVTNVFACTDGVIVHRGFNGVDLGIYLGNFVCLYVGAVNKTFTYCHLRDSPIKKGQVKSGEVLGVMGATGKALGVHLHLEGFNGMMDADAKRKPLNNEDDVKKMFFDAHKYISIKLQMDAMQRPNIPVTGLAKKPTTRLA